MSGHDIIELTTLILASIPSIIISVAFALNIKNIVKIVLEYFKNKKG